RPAAYREVRPFARQEAFRDDAYDVLCTLDGYPVDRDDRVAADLHVEALVDDVALPGYESGVRGGRSALHLVDQCTVQRAVAEPACDRRRQVLGRDADVRVLDLARREELGERPPGG